VPLFVCLDPSDMPGHCVAKACLLARNGELVVAVVPLEVPLQLPLETPLPEAEQPAHEALERARAIALAYDVDLRARVVRTRSAGEAFVEEAERERADAIVVPMRRGARPGAATEYVLRHAACRVLVAAL
jgi:nucleotide-binding universal stress UspA family protein